MPEVWWSTSTSEPARTSTAPRGIVIQPESDNWQPLSVTSSNNTHTLVTNSRLVDLIGVTLACKDANSKLVTVGNVDDEDRVGNRLLQIWELRFGHKAKLLFKL